MNAPALPFGVPAIPRLPVCALVATLDFETYSEAGYHWNEAKRKWDGPVGSREKGLSAVGSRKYAEHPTAEILTASYRLPNGVKKRWKPGDPLPVDLFAHIAAGGLVEAHNAMFERNLWTFVGQRKYGWPAVPPRQWRCSMAKGRASGFPGKLADLGAAMRLQVQKDKRGTELINLFCKPRKPTKLDPSKRVLPADDPDAFEALQSYCDTDRDTEHEASGKLPPLIPFEQEYWFADQAVNFRGLGVDLPHVEACTHIVSQVIDVLAAECEVLTGGLRPSQVQKMSAWLALNGCKLDKYDDEHITEALTREGLKPTVRRVLEIRQLTGSASVKKVFSMRSFCSDNARLHDLFIYHGARTGRDTHADVQPGNLPKSGPKLWHCLAPLCNRWYGASLAFCPWCSSSQREGEGAGVGRPGSPDKPEDWGFYGVADALEAISSKSAAMVQFAFGDALLAVSGVIRSLICAAPGNELVCSDYASIEAVVLAELAGEQWRIDAFHRKEDIYLRGASAITGISYEEYKAYPGKHPDRQSIGKVSELAFGFGGGLNSWRAFGGGGTDAEAKQYVQAWRKASPAIVELWGGQLRGKPWDPEGYEFYGLEGMAVQAILNPGKLFPFRALAFKYDPTADLLEMFLPSGRALKYREPRLTYGPARDGWAPTYQITFMTHNTNPKMGPLGWVRMGTYSGRLGENATQAVARDIMAGAVIRLEAANYPVVLRIHDELASEVPYGFGSVEEYERIMCDVEPWARGWPIRASDGWRGRQYRKG